MSRRESVQIVILGEDRRQVHFAKKFLEIRGVGGRIHTVPCPPGRGSGEQFVRERYPIELANCRRRSANVNQALVVVVDADKLSTDERKRQIEHQAGIERRRSDEKVLIVTPKRNIETWFRFLDGEEINEDDDFKGKYRQGVRPGRYAKALAKMCEREFPGNAPQSLRDACDEVGRLG